MIRVEPKLVFFDPNPSCWMRGKPSGTKFVEWVDHILNEPSVTKFVEWVDHVLKEHDDNSALEEFTLRFGLKRRHSGKIAKWLKFAFQREVKRLELNLWDDWVDKVHQCPAFPTIDKVSSFSVRHLRELFLESVDVQQEVIEYMLSNCPFLEHLCLQWTTLQNLRVCGETLKLKTLKFVANLYTKNLQISAPNLCFLEYDHRSGQGLHLDHVPVLSQLTVLGSNLAEISSTFSHNFGSITPLKRLKLDTTFTVCTILLTMLRFFSPPPPKKKKKHSNFVYFVNQFLNLNSHSHMFVFCWPC